MEDFAENSWQLCAFQNNKAKPKMCSYSSSSAPYTSHWMTGSRGGQSFKLACELVTYQVLFTRSLWDLITKHKQQIYTRKKKNQCKHWNMFVLKTFMWDLILSSPVSVTQIFVAKSGGGLGVFSAQRNAFTWKTLALGLCDVQCASTFGQLFLSKPQNHTLRTILAKTMKKVKDLPGEHVALCQVLNLFYMSTSDSKIMMTMVIMIFLIMIITCMNWAGFLCGVRRRE